MKADKMNIDNILKEHIGQIPNEKLDDQKFEEILKYSIDVSQVQGSTSEVRKNFFTKISDLFSILRNDYPFQGIATATAAIFFVVFANFYFVGEEYSAKINLSSSMQVRGGSANDRIGKVLGIIVSKYGIELSDSSSQLSTKWYRIKNIANEDRIVRFIFNIDPGLLFVELDAEISPDLEPTSIINSIRLEELFSSISEDIKNKLTRY